MSNITKITLKSSIIVKENGEKVIRPKDDLEKKLGEDWEDKFKVIDEDMIKILQDEVLMVVKLEEIGS